MASGTLGRSLRSAYSTGLRWNLAPLPVSHCIFRRPLTRSGWGVGGWGPGIQMALPVPAVRYCKHSINLPTCTRAAPVTTEAMCACVLATQRLDPAPGTTGVWSRSEECSLVVASGLTQMNGHEQAECSRGIVESLAPFHRKSTQRNQVR